MGEYAQGQTLWPTDVFASSSKLAEGSHPHLTTDLLFPVCEGEDGSIMEEKRMVS